MYDEYLSHCTIWHQEYTLIFIAGCKVRSTIHPFLYLYYIILSSVTFDCLCHSVLYMVLLSIFIQYDLSDISFNYYSIKLYIQHFILIFKQQPFICIWGIRKNFWVRGKTMNVGDYGKGIEWLDQKCPLWAKLIQLMFDLNFCHYHMHWSTN